uniref:Myotubularin phosphatase domain-containing protein n=1 Tax=Ascaris lumbricoides TaxID=6252 RepID=A0A0M3HNN6_ASCLU
MSDSDDDVDDTSTESPFGDAHISPFTCRETLLDKFETLANQLSAGWKYHVSNTEGIRKAWLSFEDFYTNICSFAGSSSPSVSSSDSPTTLPVDPQREKLALTDVQGRRISPYLCQKKLIEKVDAFVSQLSPNWSDHIANTEGIVEAWQDFERYFLRMCTIDHGEWLADFVSFFFYVRFKVD